MSNKTLSEKRAEAGMKGGKASGKKGFAAMSLEHRRAAQAKGIQTKLRKRGAKYASKGSKGAQSA
jgi:hypothetical protein